MEDNSAKVNQCEVVEWPWWLHFYLSCWPRISPQFGGLITVKMKLFADGWKWHKKKSSFDSTTFSLYCLPSHLESPLRRKLSTMTKFTRKLFSTYKPLPWVLPHWWVVQSVLARAHICITPPCYRGPPRLSAGAPPLHHIYHILALNHPLTWLLLSLLCRWYPALSVFPTWCHHRLTSPSKRTHYFLFLPN